MTTTVETDSDIWVHDYTTATGVEVAGHWRKRRAGTAAVDDDNPPRHPTASATDDTQSPGAAATVSRPPQAAAAHPSPPADTPDSPSAGTARLAAAEARYKAALVAAGVSALKHRRGEDGDLQAAIKDRTEARAELDAARAELAQQTPPVVTSSDPADGTAVAPETSTSFGADRCPGCGQFRSQDHQCPTPAGLPAGDYAGLKGDDRVKAMVADLESSVKAIVESGQLHRWLNAMASNGLSRWSANNRLLAAVQMLQRGESLDDLHMMGFRQWEKWNRKVSKGAKAVWILAPITRKIVDEDDDGKEKHRVVGFKGVPVFDVSDTHGDPLPSSPTRPVPGKATPGTLEGLRDRVGQAGYSYEETEIPGCRPETGDGTLGYTDPQSKRIVVDSRLNEAQKASTIAHELGHVHCGHVDQDYSEYQRHRGQMETEAEMSAYLVNRSRGMTRDQVDAFSPGYIAGWSRGNPTVMHQAVDKATRAFNKITDGPWPDPKES